MTIITNNFNDVNNLIRMAYDFYYTQNKTLCYDVKPINLSDIEHYSSVKRVLNKTQAYTFINSIMNDKLSFITKKLTVFGNKYIFKKNDDPYSVNLTVYVYNDTDEQNNLSNAQNINKVFLKLFSDFLSYEQTKHIMLQLLNVDIMLTDMEEFINNINIEEFKIFINNDNILNKVMSIGITEHFYKMSYLSDFLTTELLNTWTDNEYKILFFQIIHTLAIIQNKYPNFRHNNLIIKNIEGYIKNINKTNTQYSYNGVEYLVPNNGFTFKMNNFESSIIVDILINEQIELNLRTIDRLYDIRTFLKSFKKNIDLLGVKLPDSTLKFYNKYENITGNEVFPNTLLDDDYFNSFKVINNLKEDIESFKNINNKRGNINKKYNKKQDIIENKLSMQILSEDMPTSFLWKGTRKNVQETTDTNDHKYNNDLSDSHFNVNSAQTLVKKNKKNDQKDTQVFSGTRKINKTVLFKESSDIPELSDTEIKNIILSGDDMNDTNEKKSSNLQHQLSFAGSSSQASKDKEPVRTNKLASALRATNDELRSANKQYPHDSSVSGMQNNANLIPQFNQMNQMNQMNPLFNTIPASSFLNDEKTINVHTNKINNMIPQGIQQGIPNDMMSQGMQQSMPQGMMSYDMMSQGMPYDMMSHDMMPQGLPQGMMPGMMPGMPQGMMPGMPQGMPQGMMPGMPQGMPQGMMPGMPQGMSQGMPYGMPQGMMPGMMLPNYMQGGSNDLDDLESTEDFFFRHK